MGDVITLSDLRRITGQPAHVINYAIGRFGPEPSGRIGITRVWDKADLPVIHASLERKRLRDRTLTVTPEPEHEPEELSNEHDARVD
jgi:hypothetical protein